jgi:hypothetical protein
VIPEPADQIGHRERKGAAGGRPVGLDVEDYKQRNVVERFFNRLKNWRGIASRYDKLAAAPPSRRSPRRPPSWRSAAADTAKAGEIARRPVVRWCS